MELRDFNGEDHLTVPNVLSIIGKCRYCRYDWDKCIHYGAGAAYGLEKNLTSRNKNKWIRGGKTYDEKSDLPDLRGEFKTFEWQSLEEQLQHFAEDIIAPHMSNIMENMNKNPKDTPVIYLSSSIRHARLGNNINIKEFNRKIRKMESKSTFSIEKFPDRKTVTTIPLLPYSLFQKEIYDWNAATQHVIRVFDLIHSRFENKSLEIHTFIASNLIHAYSFCEARSSYMQNHKRNGCSKWIFYDRIFDHELYFEPTSTKTPGFQIIPAFTANLNEYLFSNNHESTEISTEQE